MLRSHRPGECVVGEEDGAKDDDELDGSSSGVCDMDAAETRHADLAKDLCQRSRASLV